MATIIRQNGFRVLIFTNDHGPSHVHVIKAGTEAVLELEPLAIREVYRMSKGDVREAVDLVDENRELLIAAWREIHGDQ